MAAEAFEMLVRGPAPLTLDGRAVGGGLPHRPVVLDELRAMLLHPATGRATRDAAWRRLLEQARGGSAAWVIGAVGVALPALRALVTDLAEGYRADVEDLHAAVLAGFVAGLHRIDPDRPGVITRLRWHAYRAGLAARYTRQGICSMPLPPSEPAPPPQPWGHPDLVLADAVAKGVLSPLAAELIGRSRLEDLSLKQAAAELGVGYEAARKTRQRGERHLIKAITAGDVHNSMSPPPQNHGLTPRGDSHPTPLPDPGPAAESQAEPKARPKTEPEAGPGSGSGVGAEPAGARGRSTPVSGGTPDTGHPHPEGGTFCGPARQPQTPTPPVPPSVSPSTASGRARTRPDRAAGPPSTPGAGRSGARGSSTPADGRDPSGPPTDPRDASASGPDRQADHPGPAPRPSRSRSGHRSGRRSRREGRQLGSPTGEGSQP